MSARKTLIFGVGINDADYVTRSTKVVDGHQKTNWRCPFYQAWSNMLERSYCPKYKVRKPTYAKCEVAEEWLTFSNFRAWMVLQDWQGKHLDKDVLLPGNKIYGPDFCVFISAKLNSFLVGLETSRSKLLPGTHFQKSSGMFNPQCRNPFTGKQEHLGYFVNEQESHDAWRRRKQELAEMYSALQSDQRIAAALRARFASCTEVAQ
ncbi:MULTISPECIES: hypothetical protein [Pseudomonas]|uniref:hypothetical protein n=1 Tax=Pseudomonas TaxID=286 RepID=UPI000C88910B|nr:MULTISPECIES: hypothetical protein [Pseudomonas]MBL1311256.1 hypothetical protein [Pseudomonas sp.]NNA69478.1 hypothetical protein [Pseudomonas gessardii]PMX19116.1 hypothetical protein C1Y25_00490 [Pseudomonas sp. MPBC4-3]PMX50077.1 hypothetical protein C1Y20_04205 [Pseudomonas sp. FW301-21B01]PMY10793.1 hypothetical protein C1Y18_02035 [Pseudomonas sp. MPR-R5A]